MRIRRARTEGGDETDFDIHLDVSAGGEGIGEDLDKILDDSIEIANEVPLLDEAEKVTLVIDRKKGRISPGL